MSSPNRAEYSDARGYANEFHVKELYRAEFAALLGARFRQLRWFSQRNAFVSLITPETAAFDGEMLTISKANPESLLPALPALYFLVLATNDSAYFEALTPRLSVFSDSEEWAYNDYRKIYQASQTSWKREAALEARCAELEKQIASLRSPAPVVSSLEMEQSWLSRLFKRLSN